MALPPCCAGRCRGQRTRSAAVDRIAVPQGSWAYPDPARLVADRVGAAEARPTWSSWASPSRA